ncbi:CpsD/CapB family tyrosine-protein kinase [uncultured Pseudoramibacter sp.]|uniref:CpsD/CapB family tyrosine-protein kinase n=1 Tax=uncultured Pseudoramibacter sp. TaxID=1623493 RepID=UPI0025FCF44C|nr:CpsD/CapB family tyrosine-protein kinase [uncultured Pseudoramibacter sp.]
MSFFKLGKDKAKTAEETLLINTHNIRYRESYRKLCTGLLNNNCFDSKRRNSVIMLSASKRKQGMTTTAINMALTLSEMGQKVLLVEANLHHPAFELILKFQVKNKINDYFLDPQVAIDQCIYTYKNHFDVIQSSKENSSKTINFEFLKKDMQELDYDWIIIDTPSTDEYADAFQIAESADGILLVVRKLDVERQATKKLLYGYKQNNNPVIGSILTFDNNL